ncbi:hypothetical protein CMV_026705 [Castanea mollissima]|uniref:Pentatricopeptide repeat-containing protein n=1 Tax=Castanea mollissima TaxID=60419 RepID=A0A8J4QJP3_9ROSI|nr:hypothetical protein CMV_026705 [Castanea mollissima]
MSSCNIHPNKITYTVMIDGHCKLGKTKEATELLHDMVERGILPDAVTYNALTSGFCKERKIDEAFEDSGDEKILKLLFNHFESEEEGVSNVETERLGKIALIEPEKLVTALKLALSTFAHYRKNPMKGLLPELLLLLYDQTIVKANFSKPETIPATLVGIHTIIDCATGRPEEPIRKVDWAGKVALIQCAKAMGIQKYVFYSIHNCDKHPEDIARLTFIALRNEEINGKLLTFAGPRAWTTQEVITLCERLAGQDANVTIVPVLVLRSTLQVTWFFEWTNDVSDRLTFAEVLTSDIVFFCSNE